MIKENRMIYGISFICEGICYERLNDWEKAENDFLTSLDIKPDSPNVLNYLAYGWVEREMRLDQSLNVKTLIKLTQKAIILLIVLLGHILKKIIWMKQLD